MESGEWKVENEKEQAGRDGALPACRDRLMFSLLADERAAGGHEVPVLEETNAVGLPGLRVAEVAIQWHAVVGHLRGAVRALEGAELGTVQAGGRER